MGGLSHDHGRQRHCAEHERQCVFPVGFDGCGNYSFVGKGDAGQNQQNSQDGSQFTDHRWPRGFRDNKILGSHRSHGSNICAKAYTHAGERNLPGHFETIPHAAKNPLGQNARDAFLLPLAPCCIVPTEDECFFCVLKKG